MERPQDNPSGRLNPLALRRLDLAGVLSRTGIVKLTPNAIGHWLAAGLPRNSDRTFNLIQVCAWLAAERAKRPQAPLNAEDAAVTVQLKRERLLAIRQRRRIEAGRLVEKTEVQRDQLERIYLFKNSLLAWERTLGRDLLGLPDARAIENKIQERTRDLLHALAEGWTPTEDDAEAGTIPKHEDATSAGVGGEE
ncbi:MAG: hypothetical protein ACLQVA_00115 [Candidatus Brocadiia bacterium]